MKQEDVLREKNKRADAFNWGEISLDLSDLAVEPLEDRLSLVTFTICDIPGCFMPVVDGVPHGHEFCDPNCSA